MLYLTSSYLLELLVPEYLCEINIIFYLALRFIRTLATFKKSSNKKEMEIGKEMVQLFKYGSDCRKDCDDKILDFDFLNRRLE